MTDPVALPRVRLRPLEEADLKALFEQQRDPESRRMAAFASGDPDDEAAFTARWKRLLANPEITARAVLADDAFVGMTAAFRMGEELNVTYGVERRLWGRGVATAALKMLVAELPQRPLWARAAKDNAGSLRVLEKCGFRWVRDERGFAEARGAEIDEAVLVLEGK